MISSSRQNRPAGDPGRNRQSHVADGDPDSQLLVAGTVGLHVPTYRRTWSDGPRERDVLRALDETLVDLVSRTPRGTTD